MEEERETAPITPAQAEGEREEDREAPIAPRTPGAAEGERTDEEPAR